MLPTVTDPNLTIETKAAGARSTLVRFAGTLAHRDPGPVLRPFFEELHGHMTREARLEARVDLRELKFMNSSSFKHFIAWVKRNGGLPVGQRYKIVFVLNKEHHWQQVSIHALSCFSTDAIESVYE
jgi:hypothetical protein